MSNKKKRAAKRKNSSPVKFGTCKKIVCDMDEYVKQIVEQNAQVIKDNQLLYSEIKQHKILCDRQLKAIELDVSKLNNRVSFLEKTTSLKSVNIFGVPTVESETSVDLIKMLKKICTYLKVPISDKEVDDIYRVGKEKKTIRVDFGTKLKKRDIITAVKSKELKGTDIGINSDTQIFFYEHLSPIIHKLHIEAKKLRKDKLVDFVWTSNGQVLVRVKEGQPAVVIKSCADLLKFSSNE